MTSRTILTVDDNPVNLLLLGGILQRAGYTVRAANSGSRALKMVERDAPDLILLDIEMPEMDGYEVCRSLKKGALASVPVIFLSALDNVEDKVRGFEAGGVDYVTKPFQEAEVLARVDTQLRVHGLQRDLENRNRELLEMNERLVREQQKTEMIFGAVSELLPGRVLDDTFRIETKIGSGGFGVVYRGADLKLGRSVAIKVLRPLSGDPSHIERFRTEGIAASRIKHPNAVEVYAAGFSQGVPYLVMELLRGYSLLWLMNEHGRLPIDRAISVARQVCDALTPAHAARVIHRDVTPSNIFMHQTPEGEVVKVLDFGIARLVGEDAQPGITRAGDVIGTPEFMAPERLLGGTYDASVDVYSVGVLLHRMISGASLYAEQSVYDVAETVRLHLTATPVPITTLVPETPAPLADLIASMLSRNPVARPTSREAADALRSLQ